MSASGVRLSRAIGVALLLPMLIGCATTGDCSGPIGDRKITPSMVANAPSGGYVGRLVEWGGVLIAARNLPTRTELEVLGYPLDGCGRPLVRAPSTGRFVISRPGYVETADLQPGRLVTASGHLLDGESGEAADGARPSPVLESYKPHLWPVAETASWNARPWLSIGIGGGSGGIGGGVGVIF
jgi:outer membrane lipoprotein